MNPPEAVMCWACYTPLAGGAANASSTSTPASPVVTSSAAQKQAIPKWQLGVLGVALLLGLGFGAKTFLGGSSIDDDAEAPVTSSDVPKTDAPAPAPAPAPANVPAPPPPVVTTNPPKESVVPPPQKAPYSIISAPNARYNWGTMAIVLTNPEATPRQAAGVAALVRLKMMQNKRWTILHIYVFNDRQAGTRFRQYQRQRRGAPLSADDYQALAELWERSPVRYEYNRGTEGILLPSRSPSNWWTGRTIYVKVKR